MCFKFGGYNNFVSVGRACSAQKNGIAHPCKYGDFFSHLRGLTSIGMPVFCAKNIFSILTSLHEHDGQYVQHVQWVQYSLISVRSRTDKTKT
jgi:hypothetical protein